MVKNRENKYISTIKHETLTNIGKITKLEPLWKEYRSLLDYFIHDMNVKLQKGLKVPNFTNVKPYNSDINELYNKAVKTHNKAIENGKSTRQLQDILDDITNNSIKTQLSARYVQTCYTQTRESYLSWTALLSDKVKNYLTLSSIDDKLIDNQPFLTTCYRVNKLHLWYEKPTLKWAYDENNNLVVPTKNNPAKVELPVPEEILKFLRRRVKQARKKISLPNLKKVATLKLDEKVAVLEATNNATHVNLWLKLSTLEKGKPIYIPLKNNSYYEQLLKTGVRLPSVQVCLKEGKLTVAPILEHEKAKLRDNNKEIGIDFGMVTMFAISTGERHGITSFNKLKIWDQIVTERAKLLQKEGKKLKTDPIYNKLQARIRSFITNEIGRILNKIAKQGHSVFVVEKLDFRSSKLSKRMNRLIGRTYRKVIKDKLKRLEETHGITVVEVNPAYTSQECSKCGFVSKKNRRTQGAFKCTCCGHKVNADVNASRNIIKRRSFDIKMRSLANEQKVRITRCLILETLLQNHYKKCNKHSSEVSIIGCHPQSA